MADSVQGRIKNESNDNGKRDRIICEPCEEEKTIKNAEGFCIDCQEYLCNNCFKCHLVPKPTKHHQLLDKDEMPKKKVGRDLSLVCQKHVGENMNRYCKDHDFIGCYSCIYPEHESCKEIHLLEDAVEGIETSEMYKDFFERVSKSHEEYEVQYKLAEQNYEEIVDCLMKAVTKIQAFQEKIEKTKKNINEKMTEESKKVKKIKQISEDSKADLYLLQEDLKLLGETRQSKQLFIVINREKHQQEYYEERIKTLKAGNNIQKFKLLADKELDSLVEEIGKFGKLELATTAVEAKTEVEVVTPEMKKATTRVNATPEVKNAKN